MILIRSESGQLMLVSQQALTQTQRGPARVAGQMPQITAQQVCVRCVGDGSVQLKVCDILFVLSGTQVSATNEKVTTLRMALPAPSSAPVQKNVVKVPGGFKALGL